jgi:hypothetical protein
MNGRMADWPGYASGYESGCAHRPNWTGADKLYGRPPPIPAEPVPLLMHVKSGGGHLINHIKTGVSLVRIKTNGAGTA